MTDLQYFRSDIYSTERSDKELGSERDIDGVIVSQEIESWLDDARLTHEINVPGTGEVVGLTCGESIKVFADSYYPIASVIWENNLSVAVPFFTKEVFIQNFFKIIDVYKRAGTIESFEEILSLALYNPTVTIEQLGPAEFNINVDQATEGYEMQVVSGDSLFSLGVNSDGSNYELSVQTNQNPLSTYEIIQLVETLNIHSVDITVTFI